MRGSYGCFGTILFPAGDGFDVWLGGGGVYTFGFEVEHAGAGLYLLK